MRARWLSIVLATALVVPALVTLAAAPAHAATFSNPSSITLNNPPDGAAINATPYPSNIAVFGLMGTVNHVAVTLQGANYAFASDIDALLVSPGGQSLIVVANLGAGVASNSTITFSDAGVLPPMGANTPWGTGNTFKPVNYPGFNEVFSAPAPQSGLGDPGTSGGGDTFASVFDGASPNGNWSLYVITNATDGTGTIAGGWTLDITTATNTAATMTTLATAPNPSFTADPNGSVTLTATVSSTSTVNEGTVAFKDGGTTIPGCGAVAVSAGQATCTTVFASEGGHGLSALYSGTANFGASTGTATQQVDDHTTVTGTEFCNTGSVALNQPSDTTANASPYPSHLFVSGLSGTVSHLVLSLKNTTFGHSQDIDALLVGPTGQTFILVAAAGPDTGGALSNVTLTLDDAAPTTIAASAAWGAPNATVTSRPVNYGGLNETWGPPAPAGPYGNPGPNGGGTATLSTAYNGSNPDGTWSLYVITTGAGDGTGAIAGGWCANITTGSAVATTTMLTSDNNPSFTTAPGNAVAFTATVHKASDSSDVGEGTVTFTDGGTPIAGCLGVNVVAGQAGCGVAFSVQGSHAIEAQYSGNANFGPSNSSLTQVVNDHTTVSGHSYCNTGSIALNNPTSGAADATPYPSSIFVTGAPASMVHLTVSLNATTYSHSQDIDALLVGPTGQSFILVSAAGPDTGGALSNVTLNLDDSAASTISTSAAWGAPNASVTSKPVNYGGFNETWGPPAPAGPYVNPGPSGGGTATLGSAYNGTNGNGTWSLYAITTAPGDGTGAIAGGWCVNIPPPLPPSLIKAFSAPSVPLNGSTNLTFNLSNPNATSPLTGIGFSDTLPAGLIVSTPNGESTTCNGTVTALAASTTVTLAGASLASSGTCSIVVNVTGIVSGPQLNTTSAPSSNEGGSGTPAIATVIVPFPPMLSKAFGVTSVALNATTSLTFSLSNPNTTVALSGIAFTDNLPPGLIVAAANGLGGTCTGTATAVGGSTSVSLSGATLPAGGSCTLSVNVTGVAAGDQLNTTSAITSAEGGTGATATATLAVVAPPVIAKAFGDTNVALNGTTSLTFTLTNPAANTMPLTGVAFTDNFPSGLIVATPTNAASDCADVVGNVNPGATSAGASGILLPVGGSCTFSLDVTGTTSGTKTNSVTVSSTNGGTGATSMASLSVALPPAIIKAFGAATVAVNGSTSLSFTITNPNASFDLTGVGFSDNLPAGLVVATPNGLTTTCGGTATATAGSGNVTLSGATVAAATGCMVSVNVTGVTPGVVTNSVTVSSTNAGTGNMAMASIRVVVPPTLAKAFGVDPIPFGGSTSLTFTVSNPDPAVTMAGVAFTDTLPAGLKVATPNGVTSTCGGTVIAVAGSTSAALSGGMVAANSSCTISVNVTATVIGFKVNNTSTITSTNGGTGPAAMASVTVVPAPTTTTVVASPSTAGFGSLVTFTATVVPSGPNGSGINPTGTVSFFLDGSATAITTVALSGTTASFSTAGLPARSHTVSATYNGDTNFLSSSSVTPASVNVTTTTTLTGPHTGTVVLSSGTELISGAQVTGAVVVNPGGGIDIEGSTFTGSITINGAKAVRICGSTFGSLTINGSTGPVVVGDVKDGCATNTINGSLVLNNNKFGIQVIGNHVVGGVSASGNSGAGPFPDDPTPDISGNGH